jgi:hypothetical protein
MQKKEFELEFYLVRTELIFISMIEGLCYRAKLFMRRAILGRHVDLTIERAASQSQSQSQSYITTDGQSASLSWCQAPIWDLKTRFLLL